MELEAILSNTQEILSPKIRFELNGLYRRHNLRLFTENLLRYKENGDFSRKPPIFAEETTPNLRTSYSFFQDAMISFASNAMTDIEFSFASSIERAGRLNILALMGQRMSPGSMEKFPPSPEVLLKSANIIHAEKLTVVARAWSKHAHRSPENYWGEVRGSISEKNLFANQILLNLLSNTTWWNIFGHGKHNFIYEIRTASGHGARWVEDGEKFIGFVEPFYE